VGGKEADDLESTFLVHRLRTTSDRSEVIRDYAIIRESERRIAEAANGTMQALTACTRRTGALYRQNAGAN